MAGIPPTSPVVVVLDSCHSAGFMPEVLRRDGPVMLIASSDEDATSQVAAEHQTGGYLSLGLIRALERADGSVTAGQLQDDILTGYFIRRLRQMKAQAR